MRKTWAVAGRLAAAGLVVAGWLGGAGAPGRAEADTAPPTTVALLEPAAPDGAHGWYISPVQVALAATDDSGQVSRTEYRLNGGDWTAYTEPFPVMAEGRVVLEYRSVDAAGNVEEPQVQELTIDRTPPEVEFLSPKAGVYRPAETLTVQFQARDATAGLWMADASLDGLPVANGASISLRGMAPGEHLLELFAMDMAGNEAVAAVILRIGTSARGLCDLTGSLGRAGEIRAPLLLGRLTSRCERVDALLQEPDFFQADKLLAGYISDVRRGMALGSVEPAAGSVLIAEAENLRDELAGN